MLLIKRTYAFHLAERRTDKQYNGNQTIRIPSRDQAQHPETKKSPRQRTLGAAVLQRPIWEEIGSTEYSAEIENLESRAPTGRGHA